MPRIQLSRSLLEIYEFVPRNYKVSSSRKDNQFEPYDPHQYYIHINGKTCGCTEAKSTLRVIIKDSLLILINPSIRHSILIQG